MKWKQLKMKIDCIASWMILELWVVFKILPGSRGMMLGLFRPAGMSLHIANEVLKISDRWREPITRVDAELEPDAGGFSLRIRTGGFTVKACLLA